MADMRDPYDPAKLWLPNNLGLANNFIWLMPWLAMTWTGVALEMLSSPTVAHAAPSCDAPEQMLRFDQGLKNFSRKLQEKTDITVVAIGSSSTQGVGASSPDKSYPARLQAELSRLFPDHNITVINSGAGGEEAPEMLKRFGADVVAHKPDLVIWQFGTNGALRDQAFENIEESVSAGLDIIHSIGADAVFMSLQYASAINAQAGARDMIDKIAAFAERHAVPLFKRNVLMEYWVEQSGQPDAYTLPDGIHSNDFGYQCTALSLARAIAEAIEYPNIIEVGQRPDRVAQGQWVGPDRMP